MIKQNCKKVMVKFLFTRLKEKRKIEIRFLTYNQTKFF